MTWISLSITLKMLILLFQLDYKFIQNRERRLAKHREGQKVCAEGVEKITAQ